MKNISELTIRTIAIFVIIITLLCIPASASGYPSYVLSYTENVLRVPEPYLYKQEILLNTVKDSTGAQPTDLFIYKSPQGDEFYVVETGNHRVVQLSPQGETVRIIGEGKLNTPGGVFVDKQGIYVADSGNHRIAIFNSDGEYKSEIIRPNTPLLDDDFVFTPEKLIVDDRRYFYVVCKGNENGLVMIDSGNVFRGFFGANITQVSLLDVIVRALYSRSQRAGKLVRLPYSYTNVGIHDGYIYTTTTGSDIDQVRRLGPSGSDALFGAEHKDFNDFSLTSEKAEQAFVDFAVDGDGNMFVLEETYGRIYCYDPDGTMLFAFGTNGTQKSNFLKPCSISVDSDNNIYVADSGRGSVLVFSPSDFANRVTAAGQYYREGHYDKAYQSWEQVLDSNNYYEIARQSLGYILLRKEDYKGAMEQFLLADDLEGYSQAFEEQRAITINERFPIIVGVIIIVIVALFVLSTFLAKREKTRKNSDLGPLSMAWHTIFHPFDVFDKMKYRKTAKYSHAFILVGTYIAVRIISVGCTSYLFREVDLANVNWIYEIGMAFFPWLLLCVSNYGICTLVDGEGKFKEVLVGGAYSMGPFIFFSIPLSLLTNLLSYSETGFYKIGWIILFMICIFIIFALHRELHNLTVGKTLFIGILTAVGAMLLGYLIILFCGLFIQVAQFISQIAREVMLLVV